MGTPPANKPRREPHAASPEGTPAAAAEQPAVPPTPSTEDIATAVAAAAKTAFQEALPGLKQEVADYTKTVIDAAAAGNQIDWTHPNITTTTASGRELKVADAKNRSWRTFLAGLGFDLVAAMVVIVGTISAVDPPADKAAWIGLGVLAAKTIAQTVFSYVLRMKVTPVIRTPEGPVANTPQTLMIASKNE